MKLGRIRRGGEPRVEAVIRPRGRIYYPLRVGLTFRLLLAVMFASLLSVPSCALAASGRKFVRQFNGPFSEAGGVTVDGSGDLWIVDVPSPGKLDEFSPSDMGNKFEKAVLLQENLTVPQHLVFDPATGNFFVSGERSREITNPFVEAFDDAGAHVPTWKATKKFGEPADVAVDSSGFVYVSHGSVDPASPNGDGLPAGIQKLDSDGEPVVFGGAAKCAIEACGYIAEDELTGIPGSSFNAGGALAPRGITVDAAGNIYAVDAAYNSAHPEKPQGAVVEFNSEGVFLSACTGEENPGLGAELVGWGTEAEGLRSVAVDPVSGNVLVAVENAEEGAIDEFKIEGGECKFVGKIAESSAGKRLGGAVTDIAFDESGNLYWVERHAIDVFELRHFPPAVSATGASDSTATSAVVNGLVNVSSEGPVLEDCHFEYVTNAAFQANSSAHGDGFFDLSSGGSVPCVPAASGIPADSKDHEVNASLSNLVGGVTYRYRLLASTEGALGATGTSQPLAFTAAAPPRIDSTTAENISSEFAQLRASIAPLGADTTYHFEYDTREYADSEQHGVSVPVPDGDVGSGGSSGGADASVLQQIGGLTPDTVYYFRVVATNASGTTFGAICGGEAQSDCEFKTLPSGSERLPDDRAYELLTPPNKGSAEDMFVSRSALHNGFSNESLGYPTESGQEFLLETKAAFGPFAASGQNAYVFHRDGASSAWPLASLASPSLGVQGVLLGALDPSSFARVSILDIVGSPTNPAGATRLGLVGPPGGGPSGTSYETMASESETAGYQPKSALPVGGSRDLTRDIVETEAPSLLAPKQYPGSSALYEWDSGSLAMVSVGTDGTPLECGAVLGLGRQPGTRHSAVSTDGSAVFFTAPDPYVVAPDASRGCWDGATGAHAPQLYMRTSGATIQVSAPEEGVKEEGSVEPGEAPVQHAAVFVGASEDGARAFFLTETELTSEAAAHKLHDPELYEYDAANGQLTRVSAGEAGGPAHVLNVPAISTDGTAVYFTAFGDLAEGASSLPTSAPEGAPINLYRYDTVAKTTTYVARIYGHDYPSNRSEGWWTHATSSLLEGVALETNANWYTTPDGRYLLFATTSKLSGFDVTEAAPSDCPILDVQDPQGTQCTEVYRYDSALPLSEGKAGVTDNPLCVSCDPSGERPASDGFFGHAAGPLAPAGGGVRAMSTNGQCAFFDSADPLVPMDGNGTLDVYEWEAQGSGRCQTSPPAGASACGLPQGCVRLLSSGVDAAPTFFLGASADGANVFLGTHARLVKQDTDNAGDLYDARIGGGFPVHEKTGACEGDACQNPSLAQIDATPGSFTFHADEVAVSEPSPTPKKAVLTRAQKLARALKACVHKPKRQRKRCQATARKRYGAAKGGASRPGKPVARSRRAAATTGRAGK